MPNKNLSPNLQRERDRNLCDLYVSGKYTTQQLANRFDITPRAVQRCAKKYGVIRTQAEANRIAAPLKNYHRLPKHLKVVRKHISNKRRYEIIREHPFCAQCGARPEDGIRLEVDHIDDDPTNNDRSNLQVLCNLCNRGKADLERFGSSEAAE